MTDAREDTKQNESPEEILGNLLKLMGFEGKIERFDQDEDEVLLHVETAEAARLIGRNAQLLEALQVVLNRMTRRNAEPRTHYVVDVERYRERRKDRLLQMALDAAARAEDTGRPVHLPVMGSRDRRTVHQALADKPAVRTESEVVGDEGEKRVVVFPVNQDDGARSSR